VASPGAILGACLTAGALAVTVVLVLTAAATPSAPTRVLVIVLMLVVIAVGVIGVLGALQCATLAYVLGSNSLEIRSAIDRLRIRYDRIEGIEDADLDLRRDRPALWPGAYFGRAGSSPIRIWRATTHQGGAAIAIHGPDAAFVVTPVEPGRFKDALIRRASAALRGPRTSPPTPRLLMDGIAGLDPWFRAGCVGALLLAALDVALGVHRFGAAPRHAFAGAAVLAVNAGLGCTVLSGFVGAQRLLTGAMILAQAIAIIW
jgi:hypothetical protein